MEKLKPCPFCGMPSNKLTITTELTGENVIGHMERYPYFPMERNFTIVTVSCRCGCSFRKKVLYQNEIIEAWNRRAGADE